MDERKEMWAFSFFDPIRKRWIKARYRASRKDIVERYPQYRIEGEPEIRDQELGQFMLPGLRDRE